MNSKAQLFAEVAVFAIKHKHLFRDKRHLIEWLFTHFDWDDASSDSIDTGIKLWQKHPDVMSRSMIAVLNSR
jgi:hypothetical protein